MENPTDLLRALQRDIAERLRPVCLNLSEESFEQLVRDVAAVKLKYGLEMDSGSLSEELSLLLHERRGAGGSSATT